MSALFYTSGAIALISALLVVTATNVMRALLSLLVLVLAVAAVFYTLGGPFVAALQIVVYAGAILVLFVFVVMILNQGRDAQEREKGWISGGLWYLPVLLAAVLLVEFVATVSSQATVAGNAPPAGGLLCILTGVPLQPATPKDVGMSLFTDYLIGVELASVLLLAALVAAYHYGRMPKSSEADDG